jgi:aspartyl-tRNA(Asn)/glutamyl-tRNA(Gln) amidotransferase subunit C
MTIDLATVDHVARLARLSLSAQERELFTGQLQRILDYFARLQELDLTAVEPTAHVLPAANVLREDVVQASLDRQEVLAAAPAQEEGFFTVPPVLEPV